MRAGKHLLMGLMTLLILGGDLNAFASTHKHHHPKPKHPHASVGKNAGAAGGAHKASNVQSASNSSHRDPKAGATARCRQ